MDIEYSVGRLDDEVKRAYLRLLPQQADLISRGKLDWKFDRHPAARGALAIGRMGGEIVGMVGFAPARLKLRGSQVIAFQALDTVVDPVCRGKGAFVGLGNAFYAAAGEVGATSVFGFPNENAAPGWFRRLGWTRLGSPPFLLKPLNAGYFGRRLLGPAGALLDPVPLSLMGAPRGFKDAVRIERFDERVDALWAAFSASISCTVDRRADYLNWRLADHPTAEYETHAVFGADGAMRAMVSSHLAQKHGGSIGYIMEAMALPGADRDLSMLLRGVIARMRQRKADAILAWAAPHAPNYRAYRRCGFLPMPERIRPIHLHFGARPLSPQAEAGMTGERDWYLSYLDSDTV